MSAEAQVSANAKWAENSTTKQIILVDFLFALHDCAPGYLLVHTVIGTNILQLCSSIPCIDLTYPSSHTCTEVGGQGPPGHLPCSLWDTFRKHSDIKIN
jgi:hypothetical protein